MNDATFLCCGSDFINQNKLLVRLVRSQLFIIIVQGSSVQSNRFRIAFAWLTFIIQEKRKNKKNRFWQWLIAATRSLCFIQEFIHKHGRAFENDYSDTEVVSREHFITMSSDMLFLIVLSDTCDFLYWDNNAMKNNWIQNNIFLIRIHYFIWIRFAYSEVIHVLWYLFFTWM